MKAVTFFSEKGGTGKTTLTAMFASYLAYARGLRVVAYDFDYPLYQLHAMRATDLAVKERLPSSPLARFSASCEPFPVCRVKGLDTFTPRQLELIAGGIASQTEGEGVCLLDFPGRFLPDDPACDLVCRGMIDLVVFPVDSDVQSQRSALKTFAAMQKLTGGRQRAVALWNREAGSERSGRRDWYTPKEEIFRRSGLGFLPVRMREILMARRDSSVFGFVRNTLCWPAPNIRRVCPYVEALFEDIYNLLYPKNE